MLCRHCQTNAAIRTKRGLCTRCYFTPAVRSLYPARVVRPFAHEPTMDELEALIAEQRKCLPAWWDSETERATYYGQRLD